MIIACAITGVSLTLIGVCVYGMLTQEDNATNLPLLVVGISCFAIVPLQLSSMKKISDELKRREAISN